MMRRPAMVLIDLDGTLIDSVPDLAYCVDELMARLGRPPWGEAKVRTWVGNGVERLVKRALTGTMDSEPEPEAFSRALPLFLALYKENVSVRSRLYPGVMEGLKRLVGEGMTLACVTNKAEAFTVPLLKDLGIFDFFELVVSGDSTPKKKPDPLPLLHASERLNVPAADSMMVGDSVNDVKAARAAGFAVVCVPYGYNHGRDITEAHPDAVVDRLDRLPDLFDAPV